jgi:hypothetical protein
MPLKRRYKPRARRSAGHKLLLFLIAHGGSATLWEISRATATGKLYADAKTDLEGLIVVEESRGKGSHRPVKRVSLTLKGLAAAQALRPDWTPRRLATPTVQAWFNELAAERNPWAAGLLRDAEDALHWRAHRKGLDEGRIVCGPPPPKRKPRGAPFIGQGINGPSSLDRKPAPARASVALASVPAVLDPPKPIRTPGCIICESDTLLGLTSEHDCGRFRAIAVTPTANPVAPKPEREMTFTEAIAISQSLPFRSTVPAITLPSPASGLPEQIRKAGYLVNSAGEVLYSGKWISATEWTQKMSHVKI